MKLITDNRGLSSQLGLDPKRISYIGQSFGAVLGSMVVATEPRVKTAVLNAGGGPVVDVARLQNPPLLAQAYLRLARHLFPLPMSLRFREALQSSRKTLRRRKHSM